MKQLMDTENFKNKILQGLKNLSRKQIVHFAWHCAVLPLPFFASKGSFKFFKQNDRQNHIYTVQDQTQAQTIVR